MSVVADHLARNLAQDTDRFLETEAIRALGVEGPIQFESWAAIHPHGASNAEVLADTPTIAELRRYLRDKAWVAPSQPICFLTDLHADREAFWRSLIAAGMVTADGSADACDIALVADSDYLPTAFGAKTHFIIGGDLFDKGPANLPLLDAIAAFARTGVRLTLIAGNHDVRTFLGMRFASSNDPRLAHLFVRMGKKTMTLFKEVFERSIAGGEATGRASEEEVRERLLPSESWYREFPLVAEGFQPPGRIEKELRRVREKVSELEARCRSFGMTLSDVDATLDRCEELFLTRGGAYAWVFEEMQIAHREGSLLFAHAGVDDVAACWIAEQGLDFVRERFRSALEEEPFELYNGPLGNMFRTKYRDLDLPMSEVGLDALHRSGIYAIVHGHRNVYLGQHMNFRSGMLNFACDACVDINTRKAENLLGEGSAATILADDGTIYGVSSDHPAIKVFDPALHGGWVTRV
jgi:hypothetical protein